MLKLVLVPDPVLKKETQPIRRFDASIAKLVREMEEVLVAQFDPPGVGLAGPQVGVSRAIFIMKETPDAKTTVVINPKILETKSSEKSQDPDSSTELEGCLSIPRIWSPINRADEVLLEYQDLNGNRHTERFTGFQAIIVQHEVDHLRGILFTQRAIEQDRILYKEDGDELKAMKLG